MSGVDQLSDPQIYFELSRPKIPFELGARNLRKALRKIKSSTQYQASRRYVCFKIDSIVGDLRSIDVCMFLRILCVSNDLGIRFLSFLELSLFYAFNLRSHTMGDLNLLEVSLPATGVLIACAP